MSSDVFEEALHNFTAEFAYYGAVKHLYHLGYSIPEIKKNLTYPLTEEKIADVIEKIKREEEKGDLK